MSDVGSGSHIVTFTHRDDTLNIHTGLDNVSWGYGLNVQRYPTYGGEVVQVLSAYVDDLEVEGTLTNYQDMETTYKFFLTYIQRASAGGSRDENPMTFTYPHRGWKFKIMVTEAPGYRKSRDLTVPNWRIRAHIADEEGDVETLSELIKTEAEIKRDIENPEENFGLQGRIGFTDENPFSDPWTDHGEVYKPGTYMDKITDHFSKLLPSYLSGDFDAIFGGIGSRPAFSTRPGPPDTMDNGDKVLDEASKAAASKEAATELKAARRIDRRPRG